MNTIRRSMKSYSVALIGWVDNHYYNWIVGLISTVLGYFFEVKDIVLLVFIMIFLDMVVGIRVSIMRGIGIKSKKLYRTLNKLLITVGLILLSFSIDKELGVVELHRFIAFLVCGFEFWSILESISLVSDHKLFRIIKKLTVDTVKKKIGVDLEED